MPQIISKNFNSPTFIPRLASSFMVKSALACIVTLVLGIFAGLYMGKSGNQIGQFSSVNAPAKGTYQEGYQSGLDFARKKLQIGGIAFQVGQTRSISNATVKSVGADKIVIEFDSSKLDIFSEGMTTKTVKISETTKIEKQTQKSSEEMKIDTADLQKKSQEDQRSTLAPIVVTPPLMLPSPYKTETLKLSDIKLGDIISVTSDSDITKSDAFDATSIILKVNPVIPNNLNEPPINTVPEAIVPAPSADTAVGNVPAQPEAPSADTGVIPPTDANNAPAPDTTVTTTTNTTEKPTE